VIPKKDIETAYHRIKDDIVRTPLVRSPKLSAISGANVYLKMEHLQITDSFKIRGVLTKLKSIAKEDFDKTFVAASTGNHAAAFGHASDTFGFKGVLFLPKNVVREKLNGISNHAIEKICYGNSSMEAERRATEYTKEIDGLLIHPYNDLNIIKGQGTIAVEIADQFPEVDTIIAPIGGGGLISGICSYFSDHKNISIIGCQPKNASEMEQSIRNNKIVAPSTLETVADAAAGGIERNSLTFTICKKHLSHIDTIKEEDIKKAVVFLYKYHKTIVEPTAALPVASLLAGKKYQNKNVVLVLTGKKISTELLTEINNTYGNCY